MTPQISACLIVRDEARNLEACLKSVKPHVDELVIVDTGSTDQSQEIAKRYADKFEVFLGCNDPETGLIEDFALARNKALSLASGEWFFWLDGDDVLKGGEHLRRLANEATEDNELILLPYEYHHDDKGNCTDRHYRERLIRPRHKHKWLSPVHEVVTQDGALEGTIATRHSDDVLVVHQHHEKARELGICHECEGPVFSAKNGTGRACIRCKATEAGVTPQGRNLRILKKHVARVGESDVRALYYLGVEYHNSGYIGDALRTLRRYVELATWSDEKCLAYLEMCRIYRERDEHDTAIECAFKAMATKTWAAPYFALCKSYYALASRGVDEQYNYARAAHWGTVGLMLNPENQPKSVLSGDPREFYEIHDYLNVSLQKTGKLNEAIASCESGLVGLPEHTRMKSNLRLFKGERSKRNIEGESSALVDLGELKPAAAKVIRQIVRGEFRLVAVDGKALEEEAEPVEQKPEKRDGKLDIVFYIGHGYEPWNPATFAKTGLGGSETMAWEMARHLAKLGHGVRLYGHCTPTMEGAFEGVQFYDASKYKNVSCDVLIASRRPDAVDDAHNVSATARILWVHDIHVGTGLDYVRNLRFDRIFALTNWHKEFLRRCYPTIDHDKIIVTRNGVDMARFAGEEKRDPHRAIYSSSPDRGLLTAIDCWPRIREQVPDAELHVYYGWFNWEETAKMLGDTNVQQNIQYLRNKAQDTAGVFLHDRVNQQQLAREFMKSGVWAYPTWWTETSCITAMEAQAAGCRIVTSPIAALNETVGDRGVLVPGNWEDPNYWRSEQFMADWSREVVAAMNWDDRGLEMDSDHVPPDPRQDLRNYAAEHFSLTGLAAEWDSMLTALHAECTERVVPPFHEPRVA